LARNYLPCRTGELSQIKIDGTERYLSRVNEVMERLVLNKKISGLVQGLLDFK